jgi:hypothetical protein
MFWVILNAHRPLIGESKQRRIGKLRPYFYQFLDKTRRIIERKIAIGNTQMREARREARKETKGRNQYK